MGGGRVRHPVRRPGEIGLRPEDIEAARQALARGVPWSLVQERLGALGDLEPTRYQFEKFVAQAGKKVLEPRPDEKPDRSGRRCPTCHRLLGDDHTTKWCSPKCKNKAWRLNNAEKDKKQRQASDKRRYRRKRLGA